MKIHARPLCLALVLACVTAQAPGPTPIEQVVQLLDDLKGQVETAGKQEQQQYDKMACWCDDTFSKKTAAINQAIEDIETDTNLINGYSADIAKLTQNLRDENQDLVDVKTELADAEGLRNERHSTYVEASTDNEHCVQALYFAIETLSGAGTAERGAFLGSNQQVQLQSAAHRVAKILDRPVLMNLPEADFGIMREFVNNPDSFTAGMSALQSGVNPHGDYAPKSGIIVGILKGMLEGFLQDNMRVAVVEGEQRKAYEAFVDEKTIAKNALEETIRLDKQELGVAEENMASTKKRRADTEAQLEADKIFLEKTRDACKVKAEEWSARTKCRTTELSGMMKANEILGDIVQDQASRPVPSFLQIHVPVKDALKTVQSIATKNGASDLVQLLKPRRAAKFVPEKGYGEGTGFFKQVIAKIDGLIEQLRAEEIDDIRHRDACQQWEKKNKMDGKNQKMRETKLENKIAALQGEYNNLKTKRDELQDEWDDANESLAELNENRAAAQEQFGIQVGYHLKDIEELGKAHAALKKFYKDQKLEELLQEPTYDESDETNLATNLAAAEFSECGANHGESHGILAIMDMLIEDVERELQMAREAEAQEVADYREQRLALEDLMDKLSNNIDDTETQMQQTKEEHTATIALRNGNTDDAKATAQSGAAQQLDCDWLENFDSRKEEREYQIASLTAAKGSLRGACDGDDAPATQPRL